MDEAHELHELLTDKWVQALLEVTNNFDSTSPNSLTSYISLFHPRHTLQNDIYVNIYIYIYIYVYTYHHQVHDEAAAHIQNSLEEVNIVHQENVQICFQVKYIDGVSSNEDSGNEDEEEEETGD